MSFSPQYRFGGGRLGCSKPPRKPLAVRASSSGAAAVVETFDSTDVFFRETFPLDWTDTVRTLLSVLLGCLPELQSEIQVLFS